MLLFILKLLHETNIYRYVSALNLMKIFWTDATGQKRKAEDENGEEEEESSAKRVKTEEEEEEEDPNSKTDFLKLHHLWLQLVFE